MAGSQVRFFLRGFGRLSAVLSGGINLIDGGGELLDGAGLLRSALGQGLGTDGHLLRPGGYLIGGVENLRHGGVQVLEEILNICLDGHELAGVFLMAFHRQIAVGKSFGDLNNIFNDSAKNILGGADRITDGSDLIRCLIGQLHREIALAESDNSLLRLLEGTGNIPNGAQVQEYTNGNNQDGHNKENNLVAAHTCLCRVDLSIEVVLDFTNERIPVTYGLIQLRSALCFD